MKYKIPVCIIIITLVCIAGYKAKVEWIDLFEERQVAGSWLFSLQAGDFDKTRNMMSEKALRNDEFCNFKGVESDYRQGYFENASIPDMYFNEQGVATAIVKMPRNPEFKKILLKVGRENERYLIEDVSFVPRADGT